MLVIFSKTLTSSWQEPHPG